MRLALIMGGGGIVGIAWETGVLAALRQELGFDATTASMIVGSSAGSVIGAQAAHGRDLDELAEIQRRPVTQAAAARPVPDFSTGPQAEIMRLLMSGRDDVGRRIGELATQAPTWMDEDAYVESFRRMLGADKWPSVDLRITTCDCQTGEGVAWSRSDGIGLVRAVASSCAIPGYFPTVTFEGRRYIDGPRGRGMTVRLLLETKCDRALFIGPNAAMSQLSATLQGEFDRIRRAGITLHAVTGGDALRRIGMNLMDASLRADAVRAGLEDGRDAVRTLKGLI